MSNYCASHDLLVKASILSSIRRLIVLVLRRVGGRLMGAPIKRHVEASSSRSEPPLSRQPTTVALRLKMVAMATYFRYPGPRVCPDIRWRFRQCVPQSYYGRRRSASSAAVNRL